MTPWLVHPTTAENIYMSKSSTRLILESLNEGEQISWRFFWCDTLGKVYLGPSGRCLDSLTSVGGSDGFARDGSEDLASETRRGGSERSYFLVLRALLWYRRLA